MEALSAWVISIVGVVVLGVLVDVIIPEGQTHKYVRSVFAIVTVFVIASPIPKLLGGELDFSGIFTENPASEVDSGYIDYLTELKFQEAERDAERIAENAGVTGMQAEVGGSLAEGKMIVEQISLDFSKSVMSGQTPHIDIIEEIVSKIAQAMGVEPDTVVVYGIEN